MKPLTLVLAVGILGSAASSSEGQVFRRWRARPQGMYYYAPTTSPAAQETSELIKFVRKQQHRFVRPSFSETNCFTWVDLDNLRSLIASGEAGKLIEADPDFKLVVEKLKQLTSSQRTGAYNAALRVSRKTWREMGFIDSAGRGQTEAGQQGDILVGREVVARVRKAVGG